MIRHPRRPAMGVIGNIESEAPHIKSRSPIEAAKEECTDESVSLPSTHASSRAPTESIRTSCILELPCPGRANCSFARHVRHAHSPNDFDHDQRCETDDSCEYR